MVKLTNPLAGRDFYPSREVNWSPTDRNGLEPAPESSRFPAPIHPRCLSIEAALKDCVRLPVKEFALIAVLESGEERTYSSPTLTPFQSSIFSEGFRETFRRTLKRAQVETYNEFDALVGSQEGSRSRQMRRPSRRARDDSDEDSPYTKRKRRGQSDEAPVPVHKTRQLVIGDREEVRNLYFNLLKAMHQIACKSMGKAFIKMIEPKKQTHHPYTKGDSRAPVWWPRGEGIDYVPHREPDHIRKIERVKLLVHILEMITEPRDKQFSTIQKLGLSVKKLEEAATESLSNWFADSPKNEKKRVYLKELFKIARMQERYKNGEIDGDTCVPIMYGESSSTSEPNDSDEEEVGTNASPKLETEVEGTGMPHAESLVSPRILPGHHHMQAPRQHEPEPNALFMNMRPPLSIHHYVQPQLEERGYAAESTSYMGRPPADPTYPIPSPTLHDPAAPRPSGHSQTQPPPPPQAPPPSGYHSPTQPMYGWQNPMVTGASTHGAPNFYAHPAPSGGLGPPPVTYQLPPPTLLPAPLAPHPFDVVRNPAPPQHGPFDGGPQVGRYQDYLQDHGYAGGERGGED